MVAERYSAQESWRLARKNAPKNLVMVLGLYGLSCKDPEVGKVARFSYYFLRYVDDVLDGDLQIAEDPLEHVMGMRQQIETGNFDGKYGISVLARDSLNIFERKAKPGDNPRKDFLQSVDWMVYDYLRSKDRRALNAKELGEYYWNTFSSVTNLMLIGVGSKLRATDVPYYSTAQRVYSLRDLETDWDRGTINIPEEVLFYSGLTPHSSIEELKVNLPLNIWFDNEVGEAKKEAFKLKRQLDQCGEKVTKMLCGNVVKGVLRYCEKYEREGI